MARGLLTRLAGWWLRRHRPDDTPARASLMWVWSKQISRVNGPGHEFVELARPVEWRNK